MNKNKVTFLKRVTLFFSGGRLCFHPFSFCWGVSIFLEEKNMDCLCIIKVAKDV